METTQLYNKRLVFIDTARSIAILMMLEGHFLVMSLGGEYRKSEYVLYEIWRFTRGFTAPLFFTVSGLVFTYLLVRKNKPFLQNERVRKGLKRGSELLFWGYLLQLNLLYLFQGQFSGYFFVFHVLQCIGLSLITIILLSGIQSFLKFIPLWIWLAFFGFLGFVLKPSIYSADFSAVHPMIENIFVVTSSDRAFTSVFPLFPWVGFVAFGGAIGAFVSKNPQKAYSNSFVLVLIGLGIILHFFVDPILRFVEPPFLAIGLKPFQGLGYLFARLGEVLMAFAIIIFSEIHHDYLSNLFKTKLRFLANWTVPIVTGVLGTFIVGYSLITGFEYQLLPVLSLYAFGNLLLFISGVYVIAKTVKWNMKLFLKIGQNTLSIYIIHVIILYGGLIGFGLSSFLSGKLSPWIGIAGAILFMTVFTYFIKYFEFFDYYYQKTLLFWKKEKKYKERPSFKTNKIE